MQRDFRRLAIVNRGEAAMRLIHAVRELNREQTTRVATIALYTDPDREAMFVREADETIPLGPATFVDPRDGRRKNSYLDYTRLERALVASAAEAVWVGWGFVAEHADFSELCRRLEVVFIGPDPEVMRRLGDKISAKRMAEQARVPVAPWSGGPVESHDELRRQAQRLGYPLMIKATAGGGGRGIREVRTEPDLVEAFESARAEALAAFGDATVFLERWVSGARHIEVQIIADHHGTTWAVGVRDCTIQRRHQKVIEESPSPALSPEQDRELREAAARLARLAGYQNAGTVEFLYDPERRTFSFMEVNARLQVEHPVTEMTSGLDLVKLQLHVARGGRLEGEPPPTRGHAIEVRVCAEDPENHFAPAPGTIGLFRLATGPGIRIDTGFAAGDRVPPEFDSMIAKFIAQGRSRDEAIARLQRALAESAIVVQGGTSNKAFLMSLLERAEVRSAEADNLWLDGLAARDELAAPLHADLALLQAAVDAYDAERAIERAQFLASAVRGRPRVRRDVGASVELRHRGQAYRLRVRRVGRGHYRVDPGGCELDVHVERLGAFEGRLECGGQRSRVLSVMNGTDLLIEVDGIPHRVSRDTGGVVRAPMPAVVLSVLVKEGDQVSAGDRVAVLEAMKMEMPVVSPLAGRVRQVLVTSNVQVDSGAPILLIEPAALGETRAGERETFSSFASPTARAPGWAEALDELLRLVLGFDVNRREAQGLVEHWSQTCSGAPVAELLDREKEVVAAFADIHSLFRRRRSDEDEIVERRSAQEYLLTYLRAVDTAGERLPATFLEKLRRALAYYGVSSLERGQALEEGLLGIYTSHERVEEQLSAIMAILDRWLSMGPPEPALAGDERLLLDRLIAVAQGRFAALHDLAREVRFLWFDEPLFAETRAAIYADAETALARLETARERSELDRLVAVLVECPQPLVGILARRLPESNRLARERMLEVLTRRYYRIRDLENVSSTTIDDHSWTTAQYGHDQKQIHLITTFALFSRLRDVLGRLEPLLAGVPVERDVVVDFYVWHPEPLADPDSTEQELRALLASARIPRPLRRIVFAIAKPGTELGMGGMQHFTYRPSREGYVEEKVYRGLHPMMGKRMHLWRLSNFAIERLPSVEDVYLFRAVAHGNPRDERLFALAEIRDLTPVRDEAGKIVELPYLERMLLEALAAIRGVQAHRVPDERLQWNRLLLYVWPPLDLTPVELRAIVDRLAPATEGLGLEQVVVRARMPDPSTEGLRDGVIRIMDSGVDGLRMSFEPPPVEPLRPLGEYEQKVVSLRRRGLVYAYELIRMLAPAQDPQRGEFIEYDLDPNGNLVPVARPRGQNSAHLVVGLLRNYTAKYPDGMERVILLGDASKEMGSVAEPECRRIIGALALAHELRVPVEWFTLSAGAKIAMDSGTENMDWIARVLRHLIEFTQAGGEVNVVVCGINVGAQPYWNAEATMLMHTRGILVMTADAAMVLTGKQALDYSGSVSAEDNQGIGGYDRIMGPNGQAQYWARDVGDACRTLLRHYEHSYVKPGERRPRRARTTDPFDRDVRTHAHGSRDGDGFVTIGDVFSEARNPGRKKPFEIRNVMQSIVDRDHAPLERWPDMRDAEIAVVWDAHLGGYPVCMIGMESRPLTRLGFVPADGPDQWTAGTLFPRSSKKVARALNAVSGNRPAVVIANLSGFDGSPESMRNLQLEYGAEIGRAVVNFRGPIVFCVVSRYHGGAFVVFSKALNQNLEAAALKGAYASVIGGAPAAAVVFARDVDARTRADARVRALEEQIGAATADEKGAIRARLGATLKAVRSEKLGQVAEEFDHVHTVERALSVGSLDRIVPPACLRPYLIEAIERGLSRDGATT